MQTRTDLRERFATDGYVVIPGFKSAADIAALRARAAEIVEAFDPRQTGAVFSTKPDAAHKSAEYFLSSGTSVRCFFEEEAFDAAGRLRVPKPLAINKIGHAMHDLDPVFDAFSHGAALDALARDIGNDDPRVYQSMYIFKQPHIGGEVRWHQDATFFGTEPETVTTLWFALEDAGRDNGCLWVQPGGHRSPLRERAVLAGGRSTIVPLDGSPWPTEDEAVPLECEAGTVVMFHGYLPHYSAPNRSSVSRHAYTLHFVDGRARYSEQNWLQRGPSLPVRGFIAEKRS
jgi:phytanoyl-CoA hydroxylase